MSLLKHLWQRLDDLQRRRGVRWVLSIVFAAIVVGYFGSVWNVATSLRHDGQAIVDALRESNLSNHDEVAVRFAEKGIVQLPNGHVYGNEQFAKISRSFYGMDGRIIDVNGAARVLLQAHAPRWAPAFLLNNIENISLLGFIALALIELTVWVGLAVPFLVTAICTAVVCGLLAFLQAGDWVIAAGSIGVLLFCFALLVRSASMFLGRSTPIFAIAATVLREAVRLKIATFFVGLLLIAIPLLPLTIARNEPLRYQIQTFISRSMSLLFLLAAFMTVFLACATVAFEIRDKQIWQLMTKPVARLQYLLGKWLGVVTVNVILVFLGGVATFTYVEYLQTREPKDSYDSMAVREEILVARQGRYPTYQVLSGEQALADVEAQIASDPVLKMQVDNGERSEADLKRELARGIHQRFLAEQRTINPGLDNAKKYVFEGLEQAKSMHAMLTLRYAFDIGRIDPHETHPVIFQFPHGAIARDFVPAQSHVLQVPSDEIDDKGRLEVTVVNGGPVRGENGATQVVPGASTMAFKGDSFEVLYRVDTFEWNFLRALTVQFLKLSFLAMFGVCVATVLSFPVASILTFTVLAIGAIGPFLGMSLDEYYVKAGTPVLLQGLQYAIKGIATASEWMLRSFGETRPTARLVEGRVIGWGDVLRTFVMIGAVWTVGALLLGYAAFRRKELATYSGNQ